MARRAKGEQSLEELPTQARNGGTVMRRSVHAITTRAFSRRATHVLAATLLGAIWLTMPASAVLAAQPDRIVLTFDEALFVDDTTCDFAFEESVTGHVIITTFFDQDGNPTRQHVNVTGRAEATNPASGRTLRAVQANLIDMDLSAGETTTAGLRFLAHVPGGGVVLLDAGRVVVADGQIVFEAGPHQLIHGDVEEFCAYLAG